jgi:dTDP-4-amino-4,6-dideoxygalactose transaminase
MKEIKMVDLQSQYLKIKSEIDAKFDTVFSSAHFIQGEAVADFKKHLAAYLQVKHVIPCGNGTDALQIALMSLDLSKGDEVITSPFSFIAATEVIELLGLTPVFVDVDPDTFNIDTAKIEAAITKRTKAVIPVHLFGQCCQMEQLLQIVSQYNLAIIEDACQSIGADFLFSDGTAKKSGTMGNMGCTSFFPSKNLGCYGDGGAIFTNDDELAEKTSAIASHGSHHRYFHDRIGVNSRLDTLQAAVLDVKLQYLDNYNDARRKAAYFYTEKLKNHPHITTPLTTPHSSHVFHQYTLQLHNVDRKKTIHELKALGIPCAVYYPVPLHLQKAFAQRSWHTGDFPVAEKLCQQVLSLPIHTELVEEQLDFITSNLLKFI